MANSSGPAKSRKIIDVTEPGKSAPSASGRPIIVTNRPMMMQDPMMVGDEAAAGPSDAVKTPTTVASPIKIEPLQTGELVKETPPSAPALPKKAAESLKIPTTIAEEAQDKKVDDMADKSAAPVEEPLPTAAVESDKQPSEATLPAAIVAVSDKKESAVPTEPQPETKPPEVVGEEGTSDDQLAPNQAFDEAKKKEEEQQAAKLAEQEKIIESRKYYLPINSIEKKRGLQRAVLALVIVILLTLVWLDVVLDAGIVTVSGIHSLTHFFSP